MQKGHATVDDVITGISQAPLDLSLRNQLSDVVRQNAEWINARLNTAAYKPPGDNYEGVVTYEITSFLHPLLQKQSIPVVCLEDTWKHIYEAIGGRRPVQYEAPPTVAGSNSDR